MLDFLSIATRNKKSQIEVYPKFKIMKSSDLMIRGSDFYAVWVEERGLWSTDEQDALQLIDLELDKYAQEHREEIGPHARICYMWDAETGMVDAWHRYCQKQQRDNYNMLDEKLVFSNAETNKKDYASKRLGYPLEKGPIPAYEKIMSTLYTEEERHKIEWAIGSIVSGDSKWIQKFMVLYGAAGTGKSTVLNIIQQLFDGYYSVFDAKALGSNSNSFALEAFKKNPLVAIQHDGDLSKIEDNTRLNSLVSHELMTINEKFKSTYENRFKCFLFMGTNRPVKITDGKSGLLRRLIDVTPSGNKLSPSEYKRVVKQVSFELGGIAWHCQEVYLEDPGYYDDYMPVNMLGASNDFYNFIIDSFGVFKKEDGTTLKAAWEMYKTYCEEAKLQYPFTLRTFKEELKNYFDDFDERFTNDDGSRIRSYYSGFKTDKFDMDLSDSRKEKNGLTDKPKESNKEKPAAHLIKFEARKSIFDKECADCPAQYATPNETPIKKWEKNDSILSELDTSQLHYVKVPDNHIVIDFDIPDANGNKCFEKNLEEASKWPATYAELSKSGAGIHLHYIYSGDVSKLSRIYDDHIEVKVFTGKSSLRRKLTKCNDLPIATISSGLPLKGEDKLINWEGVKSEKILRTMIKRNLNREYHANTKPSVDYIHSLLNDAYNSGLGYDVTDLKNTVFAFAATSTNQADYCIKLVNEMKFKSEEPSEYVDAVGDELVFYDVEVFPNLFLVNWKIAGEGKPVVRMINPTPTEIEGLLRYKLVGFNCRRYDNHILYARLMGYDNEQLYNLSKQIINAKKGENRHCFFGEAYNLSYTDIYDFASAGNKKSLKKLEIEMGIHHQELGLPWDEPVPEDMWLKVAEYCDNDVLATEAAFHYLSADWTARQILADMANSTVNDSTNSLTARIIFENERKPQGQFNYRFMGDTTGCIKEEGYDDGYTVFDNQGRPVFPGYTYEAGKSTYRGEEVGEGGYVYAEPGMYTNVALIDVASMHPHSIIAEELFGPKYTARFKDIVDARVAIKHEDWDKVNKMLDGKLARYVQKVIDGKMSSGSLADATKTAINAVYGQTFAKYDNVFRDIRNKDNIVAKRGALFMVNLKHEVQKRGFTVVHIKTDSIKIANATTDIIEFVNEYGKLYGYSFEHEATYDRMCLVNNAVYIAKYATVEQCNDLYGLDYVMKDNDTLKKNKKKPGTWTATGEQFAVPYVFKKLFTHEDIEFNDLCETYEVKSALYLDMNENLPEGEHDYRFIGKVGLFCPIKPGCAGGELRRQAVDKDGNVKYDSATGADGYRWLEAEFVEGLGTEMAMSIIDASYYDELVNAAIYGKGKGKQYKPGISDFGDFEWFVSDDEIPSDEALAHLHPAEFDLPWKVACGKDTCFGCPNLKVVEQGEFYECDKGYDISDLIIVTQMMYDDGDAFDKR